MKEYKVIWEIELEATSPQHAASLAQEIMQDQDSGANYFTVTDPVTQEDFNIDLDED